jgi:PAS domain S-box-containing protein
MSNYLILLYSITFIFLILILLLIIRIFINLFKEQKRLEKKDLSKVSFVVDTFHDLVSKLKEKEKELELLRKKAEERAITIEGYNENILQSVPSGVISLDENLKITKVNQSAEKILDIKASEVIERTYLEVFSEPITNLLKENKFIERAEISYTTPSGRRIWLGLTLTPLKNTEGKTIGQILIFTDLTQLKAFESQIALKEKLSSLGEISAGIAHELRNPMGVIAGYTKILLKKIDPSLKPVIEAIIKEIQAMDRIISDFLSFTRLTELHISEFNLFNTLNECLSSVIKDRNDINIKIEIDKDLKILGDEVLLKQAFINLFQNSLEAMPNGGDLTIEFNKTNDYYDIIVSDTGYGISDNIKDKIFLPFFTTKEKGTGLGLAIVQKNIVSHGGNISLENSLNGTTFRIKLPKQDLTKSIKQA